MNAYTPRRCSSRWLDADCPKEILCIIDLGGNEAERYDVFYAEMQENGRERWLNYFCLSERGYGYHGEMQVHAVADYRYRMKHRYTKWSTLPDAVKNAVRQDIAMDKEWADA